MRQVGQNFARGSTGGVRLILAHAAQYNTPKNIPMLQMIKAVRFAFSSLRKIFMLNPPVKYRSRSADGADILFVINDIADGDRGSDKNGGND